MLTPHEQEVVNIIVRPVAGGRWAVWKMGLTRPSQNLRTQRALNNTRCDLQRASPPGKSMSTICRERWLQHITVKMIRCPNPRSNKVPSGSLLADYGNALGGPVSRTATNPPFT